LKLSRVGIYLLKGPQQRVPFFIRRGYLVDVHFTALLVLETSEIQVADSAKNGNGWGERVHSALLERLQADVQDF
jgi:hypothetical protein